MLADCKIRWPPGATGPVRLPTSRRLEMHLRSKNKNGQWGSTWGGEKDPLSCLSSSPLTSMLSEKKRLSGPLHASGHKAQADV